MGALVLLIFLAAMYFLPSVIAGARNHKNATAITVLNLLLGWTILGWVISLVWAFTNPSKTQVVYLPPGESSWHDGKELGPGSRRELPSSPRR